MKPVKRVVHVARHIPTGAEIPIVINKKTGNVITDFKEVMDKRKGFTLLMLQDRWDLCREDVIELLQKFQVPAHINHQDVTKLKEEQIPLDVALFFQEYIRGIERKTKMAHNKLKAKSLETVRSH